MCNHYSIYKKVLDIENRFGANFNYEFQPYYHTNGFDHNALPVITNEEPNIIQAFNWGLVPSWTRNYNEALVRRAGNLNARNDTIFEKPSFRQAITKRRCLIIADGFFEHMHVAKDKIPHYVFLKDQSLFSFAGIWETWTDKSNPNLKLDTFSMITTDPNPLMERIHNSGLRMPVILLPEHEKKWLTNDLSKEEIIKLMIPYDDNLMSAHEVSRLISKKKVNTNVQEVIKAVPKSYLEI